MNIDEAFDRAVRALDEGRSLRGTGFWAAVDELRRNSVLAIRYADRAAAIDRRAFETGVRLRVPIAVGLWALTLLSGIGVAAVVVARLAGAPVVGGWYEVDPDGLPGFVPIMFLIGFGALLLGTHSLAHWLVGRLAGIRFTHVFLGGPPPPRPGVKTDYASYLRAAPVARAAMHASGAVLTKIVPFALLAASIPLYDGWPWLTWILLVAGVGQILTDVFLSTKVSDWKKVRRELR